VNMKDMKQMIKPWAAGIFATCLPYLLHLSIDLIFQQLGYSI
jgi:hypothetical protein